MTILSSCYRSLRALHTQFQAWSKKDIWDDLFKSVQTEPDTDATMIDSAIVKAHA